MVHTPARADDVAVLSDESNEHQFLVNICKDTSNLETWKVSRSMIPKVWCSKIIHSNITLRTSLGNLEIKTSQSFTPQPIWEFYEPRQTKN